MLKKENRLAAGVRFDNSRSVAVPEFVFKEKDSGLPLNRFGIVVSKKIDKRAVVRNKIKRFFRDSLVELLSNMTAGHDMLFITKQKILDKTKEEIRLLIKRVLQQRGIISA